MPSAREHADALDFAQGRGDRARMLRATILPLGLLLLASACGGKDDSDDDGTGAPMTGGMTNPTTGGGETAASMSEPDSSGGTHETHETGTPGETGEMSTSDATTDPTGGALTCDGYCGLIASNCTGAVTQYGMTDFCMKSCEAFPVGSTTDTSGNTLGCRTYHAGAAPMDPALHCPHAGPGGAGACGSNCDGFCSIAMHACPDAWPGLPECMAACGMFMDTETYDASDVGGNTLACRLYHATAAAFQPMPHCMHIKADSPPCQ